MSITVQFHGDIARIMLSGQLDYSTQREMSDANHKALEADNIREIEVNFAQVTFMDSSGIRALFELQKNAEAKGKSLVLVNCNNSIRELFEIGGFDRRFTLR